MTSSKKFVKRYLVGYQRSRIFKKQEGDLIICLAFITLRQSKMKLLNLYSAVINFLRLNFNEPSKIKRKPHQKLIE